MNIVTGQIAHPDVNADDTVNLRQLAMKNFKAGRPGGEMKIKNSKSTLKLKFEMVISERNCPIPEIDIYDVSAFLCVLTWLSDEMHVYVDALLLFVHQSLQKSNATLVIDRNSRGCRDGSSRVHKLTPEMPAPAKPVILTNTKNKIQLNAVFVEGLLYPDYYTKATQKHTLMNAGVSDVPVEIVGGVRIDRHDLCSTHEVADIVITQRVISCSLSGSEFVLCAMAMTCLCSCAFLPH